MKWSEKTTFQKILFVLAILCGVAHITLTTLEIFDIYLIHGVVSRALFGIFFLLLGVQYPSKKISILYYIVAALWFLSGVLRIII